MPARASPRRPGQTLGAERPTAMRSNATPSGEGKLKRQSPLVVFGLFLLTLGVYGAFWIRKQARFLDERIPGRPISNRFTATLIALWVADLLLFVGSLVTPEGTFHGIEEPVSAFASGFLLLGALRVRRRILYLAEIPGTPPPKVSLLGTIFLNAAYLQAKINRYRERLEAPRWNVLERRFRDSRRFAWFASLALPSFALCVMLTIGSGSLVIDGIGTMAYRHARERAIARFGPLTEERFESDEAEPHPVLALGARLELPEGAGDRLNALAKAPDPVAALTGDDRRFVESLLQRNREALSRLDSVLDPLDRGLGVSYPVAEDAEFPPDLVKQTTLARFVFFDGLLALDERGPGAAEPAVRHLGVLARLLEDEPNIIPLLLGIGIENLQLRLLASTIERCPDATTAERLESDLVDLSMEQAMREALAWQAALMIQVERDEVARYAAEQSSEEEGGPLFRAIPFHLARGATRYAVAGALDWLVRHQDAYEMPYSVMRTSVEIDPDKLSFVEKMHLVAAMSHWGIPAKSRAFSDARRGARLALQVLEDGPGDRCAGLQSRLGPLAELYRVADEGSGGCTLRYRRAEEFERAAAGDFPAPPFGWRLGCRRDAPQVPGKFPPAPITALAGSAP